MRVPFLECLGRGLEVDEVIVVVALEVLEELHLAS